MFVCILWCCWFGDRKGIGSLALLVMSRGSVRQFHMSFESDHRDITLCACGSLLPCYCSEHNILQHVSLGCAGQCSVEGRRLS